MRNTRHPVQGQQHLVVQGAVALHHALAHQTLEQLLVQRLQGLRGDGIEQVANLVVAGDGMHSKQGLRVVVPLRLLHAPLKLQK